jgi:hypothetical protein
MIRNPFGNSFSMNPYRLAGLPSLNTLDKKFSGDLTKLTKSQFEQMTRDKQNTNLRQAFATFSQFPPLEDTTTNMQNSFTSSPSSFRSMPNPPSLAMRNPPMGSLREDKKGGKLDSIRGLLSGASGAAIGGIAQGAGSVIGSYLDRKTERERLKEAKRQAEREERQQDEIRKLLMPLFEKQAARFGQQQNLG